MKKIMLLFALLITTFVSFGQEKVKMADFMRSNGRIFVVVLVVVTILSGLILYVARLDRKISKLEKEK